MRYRGILFDMDGTVLDTLADLADSMNQCLSHFSLPTVSYDHARACLGYGADYYVKHCLLEGSDDGLVPELLAWYRPWYDAHCLIKTKPYDGILPLMEALRAAGCLQAIISNKPDTAVQELAEAFFPGLLELSVGESPSVRCKPAPDTVLAAAERMGLSRAECVYIGDTEVDLETARNARMDCIAVTWGFRTEEQLLAAGAKRIAHCPAQLQELLLS
ncbi:MAG: HAD family hydrolase [Oscillospiraceae bacterium]|nr:HAD family hydrolase [Oscillospiraceae bacterium]